MTAPTTRHVALQLQDNEDNRRVIEAIEADNPDVTVRRLPGLVDLQSPSEITVNRGTVERILGSPWGTEELQIAMISYAGHFAEWDDDRIVIRWEH